MTKAADGGNNLSWHYVSPTLAFIMVSLSLGELGDGLNIFQGIYLVGIGWNEGSVGTALSLMGFTSLLVQPFAGDWVDKATIDRRVFLTLASIATALSASTILLVREGNTDHALIYTSKIVEGIASSFIAPCLAALTLASFGPNHFDAVMASNVFWGHLGSVFAAILAGLAAYILYPNIKYCFLVIGVSALIAIGFIQYLPQGDPLLGRGLRSREDTSTVLLERTSSLSDEEEGEEDPIAHEGSRLIRCDSSEGDNIPTPASYLDVFLDPKTCILSFTGFFFHFANANVLLVLGELMGSPSGGGGGSPSRTAMPLTAGAIVTAQITMAIATFVGDRCTKMGIGRKPLFMAALLSLPIRCALIVLLKDAGSTYLTFTQVLDGIGGGLFGLIYPYIVADITFGTGRFNAVMGLTASCFGLGATLSNYLGQMVVEHYGHVASLLCSLLISFIPIALFSTMPETYGCRGGSQALVEGKEKEHLALMEGKEKEYRTFFA